VFVTLGDGDSRSTYGVPDRSTGETTDAAPTGTADIPAEPIGGTGSNDATGTTGPGGGPDATTGDHHPPATVPDPPDPDESESGRWEFDVTELAPGLSADAAWGPDRLAAAHRSVLDDRSFRVHYRRVVTPSDEERRVRVVEAGVAADRGRYRVREVVSRPADGPRGGVVTGYWSGGGNETLRTIAFAGTRTYGRLEAADLPDDGLPGAGDPTHRALVERAFAATVLTGVESVPDAVAPAKYWVFATGNRADRITRNATPVRNLSLRALVDSRGLVHRLHLSYERRDGDAWVGVTTNLAFDGVGRTAIDPPTWVDNAPRAGNESDPIGGN